MIIINLSFEITFVQWGDSRFSLSHSTEKAGCSSGLCNSNVSLPGWKISPLTTWHNLTGGLLQNKISSSGVINWAKVWVRPQNMPSNTNTGTLLWHLSSEQPDFKQKGQEYLLKIRCHLSGSGWADKKENHQPSLKGLDSERVAYATVRK